MNERLTQLYRSVRSKEALASQDQFNSANVLLGSEVEKFAELIVRECCETVERRYKYSNGTPVSFWQMSQDVQDLLKEHFGVKE